MSPGHPLLSTVVLGEVERAVSDHLGQPWRCTGMTDLADRSSHPAAVLHGPTLSIFAKLLSNDDAAEQARAETAGLALIHDVAGVRTPVPVGAGHVDRDGWSVVVFESLQENPPERRTVEDWRAIGRALAEMHVVTGERFGLDDDGFFGPLHQDNRPVATNTWTDFYAHRRVLPRLRSAVDAGTVTTEQARDVERVMGRLELLAGPEQLPSLLHGDAQHHNFVSTNDGAVVIDASPYYGHPELDLALVDYFTPVPHDLFDTYRDLHDLDPGFPDRRELWRIFAYLSVLTVDGSSAWARGFVDRLSAAVATYR